MVCAGGKCSCPSGKTQCGNTCVDLYNDQNNCGACGTVCPSAQTCAQGICVCPTAGQLDYCPASNICTNLDSDVTNCGTCGHTLPVTRDLQSPAGCICPHTDAILHLRQLCTDINNDPNNCGGCGNICSDCQTRTRLACNQGVCGPAATNS